jgi:diguanylate cyclase (GGDEF)-like protein
VPPRRNPSAQRSTREQCQVTSSQSSPDPLETGPNTILLVEDDPDVSTLIQQLLAEDGYRVLVAASGEEGRQQFDPLVVDLVVLDTMLPGMSGWELCREIKRDQPRPFVPVLMLTARSGLQDRVRGLDAGADDYLTKPFDIDELLAHVRAMLRIRRAEVKLWRHAQELEVLNAVATAVNSSLDLTEILSLAIVRMTETARASVGAIWLNDAGDASYRLVAQTGLTAEQVQALQHDRPIGGTLDNLSPGTPGSHNGHTAAGSWELAAGNGGDPLRPILPRLTSVISLPLTSKAATLGLLALGSERADAFDPALVKLLHTLAATVAVAADNARLYSQTRRIADTDPVTGLFNHRYMQDAIESEIYRSQRTRRPFAIMMMDLDNFKAYNDTFFHQAGDQLLRETATMLTAICRKIDSVGRYGGDEFIILLPETNAEQAKVLAGRIQTTFETLPGRRQTNQVAVGLSVGVAIYPFDSAVRQQLINAADTALYQAKRGGKSRTIVARGSAPIARPADQSSLDHLAGLVRTSSQRTGFEQSHAEQTAHYAGLLAAHIRLPESLVAAVRIAGLLHDVGNIGIPAELLSRPGPLSDEEIEVVRQHVILSEMLIDQVPHIEPVMQAVIHHHERWDGLGYPRGLRGELIPLLGRLLMVADAYAAMRAPRPYRPALTQEEALIELERGAGRQFDPALVSALSAVLREVVARSELTS